MSQSASTKDSLKSSSSHKRNAWFKNSTTGTSSANGNPLNDDAQLRRLLKNDINYIDSATSFTEWRTSFLQILNGYLGDKCQTDAAKKSYYNLSQIDTKIIQLFEKVSNFMSNDELSCNKSSVRARKCLSELGNVTIAAGNLLDQLIPSTSNQERISGYTKFHIGAVLIEDGFREYTRLEMIIDTIHSLCIYLDTNTPNLKDITNQMRFFETKIIKFCDVMADLGLFTAMITCRTYADEAKLIPNEIPCNHDIVTIQQQQAQDEQEQQQDEDESEQSKQQDGISNNDPQSPNGEASGVLPDRIQPTTSGKKDAKVGKTEDPMDAAVPDVAKNSDDMNGSNRLVVFDLTELDDGDDNKIVSGKKKKGKKDTGMDESAHSKKSAKKGKKDVGLDESAHSKKSKKKGKKDTDLDESAHSKKSTKSKTKKKKSSKNNDDDDDPDCDNVSTKKKSKKKSTSKESTDTKELENGEIGDNDNDNTDTKPKKKTKKKKAESDETKKETKTKKVSDDGDEEAVMSKSKATPTQTKLSTDSPTKNKITTNTNDTKKTEDKPFERLKWNTKSYYHGDTSAWRVAKDLRKNKKSKDKDLDDDSDSDSDKKKSVSTTSEKTDTTTPDNTATQPEPQEDYTNLQLVPVGDGQNNDTIDDTDVKLTENRTSASYSIVFGKDEEQQNEENLALVPYGNNISTDESDERAVEDRPSAEYSILFGQKEYLGRRPPAKSSGNDDSDADDDDDDTDEIPINRKPAEYSIVFGQKEDIGRRPRQKAVPEEFDLRKFILILEDEVWEQKKIDLKQIKQQRRLARKNNPDPIIQEIKETKPELFLLPAPTATHPSKAPKSSKSKKQRGQSRTNNNNIKDKNVDGPNASLENMPQDAGESETADRDSSTVGSKKGNRAKEDQSSIPITSPLNKDKSRDLERQRSPLIEDDENSNSSPTIQNPAKQSADTTADSNVDKVALVQYDEDNSDEESDEDEENIELLLVPYEPSGRASNSNDDQSQLQEYTHNSPKKEKSRKKKGTKSSSMPFQPQQGQTSKHTTSTPQVSSEVKLNEAGNLKRSKGASKGKDSELQDKHLDDEIENDDSDNIPNHSKERDVDSSYSWVRPIRETIDRPAPKKKECNEMDCDKDIPNKGMTESKPKASKPKESSPMKNNESAKDNVQECDHDQQDKNVTSLNSTPLCEKNQNSAHDSFATADIQESNVNSPTKTKLPKKKRKKTNPPKNEIEQNNQPCEQPSSPQKDTNAVRVCKAPLTRDFEQGMQERDSPGDTNAVRVGKAPLTRDFEQGMQERDLPGGKLRNANPEPSHSNTAKGVEMQASINNSPVPQGLEDDNSVRAHPTESKSTHSGTSRDWKRDEDDALKDSSVANTQADDISLAHNKAVGVTRNFSPSRRTKDTTKADEIVQYHGEAEDNDEVSPLRTIHDDYGNENEMDLETKSGDGTNMVDSESQEESLDNAPKDVNDNAHKRSNDKKGSKPNRKGLLGSLFQRKKDRNGTNENASPSAEEKMERKGTFHSDDSKNEDEGGSTRIDDVHQDPVSRFAKPSNSSLARNEIVSKNISVPSISTQNSCNRDDCKNVASKTANKEDNNNQYHNHTINQPNANATTTREGDRLNGDQICEKSESESSERSGRDNAIAVDDTVQKNENKTPSDKSNKRGLLGKLFGRRRNSIGTTEKDLSNTDCDGKENNTNKSDSKRDPMDSSAHSTKRINFNRSDSKRDSMDSSSHSKRSDVSRSFKRSDSKRNSMDSSAHSAKRSGSNRNINRSDSKRNAMDSSSHSAKRNSSNRIIRRSDSMDSSTHSATRIVANRSSDQHVNKTNDDAHANQPSNSESVLEGTDSTNTSCLYANSVKQANHSLKNSISNPMESETPSSSSNRHSKSDDIIREKTSCVPNTTSNLVENSTNHIRTESPSNADDLIIQNDKNRLVNCSDEDDEQQNSIRSECNHDPVSSINTVSDNRHKKGFVNANGSQQFENAGNQDRTCTALDNNPKNQEAPYSMSTMGTVTASNNKLPNTKDRKSCESNAGISKAIDSNINDSVDDMGCPFEMDFNCKSISLKIDDEKDFNNTEGAEVRTVPKTKDEYSNPNTDKKYDSNYSYLGEPKIANELKSHNDSLRAANKSSPTAPHETTTLEGKVPVKIGNNNNSKEELNPSYFNQFGEIGSSQKFNCNPSSEEIPTPSSSIRSRDFSVDESDSHGSESKISHPTEQLNKPDSSLRNESKTLIKTTFVDEQNFPVGERQQRNSSPSSTKHAKLDIDSDNNGAREQQKHERQSSYDYKSNPNNSEVKEEQISSPELATNNSRVSPLSSGKEKAMLSKSSTNENTSKSRSMDNSGDDEKNSDIEHRDSQDSSYVITKANQQATTTSLQNNDTIPSGKVSNAEERSKQYFISNPTIPKAKNNSSPSSEESVSQNTTIRFVDEKYSPIDNNGNCATTDGNPHGDDETDYNIKQRDSRSSAYFISNPIQPAKIADQHASVSLHDNGEIQSGSISKREDRSSQYSISNQKSPETTTKNNSLPSSNENVGYNTITRFNVEENCNSDNSGNYASRDGNSRGDEEMDYNIKQRDSRSSAYFISNPTQPTSIAGQRASSESLQDTDDIQLSKREDRSSQYLISNPKTPKSTTKNNSLPSSNENVGQNAMIKFNNEECHNDDNNENYLSRDGKSHGDEEMDYNIKKRDSRSSAYFISNLTQPTSIADQRASTVSLQDTDDVQLSKREDRSSQYSISNPKTPKSTTKNNSLPSSNENVGQNAMIKFNNDNNENYLSRDGNSHGDEEIDYNIKQRDSRSSAYYISNSTQPTSIADQRASTVSLQDTDDVQLSKREDRSSQYSISNPKTPKSTTKNNSLPSSNENVGQNAMIKFNNEECHNSDNNENYVSRNGNSRGDEEMDYNIKKRDSRSSAYFISNPTQPTSIADQRASTVSLQDTDDIQLSKREDRSSQYSISNPKTPKSTTKNNSLPSSNENVGQNAMIKFNDQECHNSDNNENYASRDGNSHGDEEMDYNIKQRDSRSSAYFISNPTQPTSIADQRASTVSLQGTDDVQLSKREDRSSQYSISNPKTPKSTTKNNSLLSSNKNVGQNAMIKFNDEECHDIENNGDYDLRDGNSQGNDVTDYNIKQRDSRSSAYFISNPTEPLTFADQPATIVSSQDNDDIQSGNPSTRSSEYVVNPKTPKATTKNSSLPSSNVNISHNAISRFNDEKFHDIDNNGNYDPRDENSHYDDEMGYNINQRDSRSSAYFISNPTQPEIVNKKHNSSTSATDNDEIQSGSLSKREGRSLDKSTPLQSITKSNTVSSSKVFHDQNAIAANMEGHGNTNNQVVALSRDLTSQVDDEMDYNIKQRDSRSSAYFISNPTQPEIINDKYISSASPPYDGVIQASIFSKRDDRSPQDFNSNPSFHQSSAMNHTAHSSNSSIDQNASIVLYKKGHGNSDNHCFTKSRDEISQGHDGMDYNIKKRDSRSSAYFISNPTQSEKINHKCVSSASTRDDDGIQSSIFSKREADSPQSFNNNSIAENNSANYYNISADQNTIMVLRSKENRNREDNGFHTSRDKTPHGDDEMNYNINVRDSRSSAYFISNPTQPEIINEKHVSSTSATDNDEIQSGSLSKREGRSLDKATPLQSDTKSNTVSSSNAFRDQNAKITSNTGGHGNPNSQVVALSRDLTSQVDDEMDYNIKQRDSRSSAYFISNPTQPEIINEKRTSSVSASDNNVIQSASISKREDRSLDKSTPLQSITKSNTVSSSKVFHDQNAIISANMEGHGNPNNQVCALSRDLTSHVDDEMDYNIKQRGSRSSTYFISNPTQPETIIDQRDTTVSMPDSTSAKSRILTKSENQNSQYCMKNPTTPEEIKMNHSSQSSNHRNHLDGQAKLSNEGYEYSQTVNDCFHSTDSKEKGIQIKEKYETVVPKDSDIKSYSSSEENDDEPSSKKDSLSNDSKRPNSSHPKRKRGSIPTPLKQKVSSLLSLTNSTNESENIESLNSNEIQKNSVDNKRDVTYSFFAPPRKPSRKQKPKAKSKKPTKDSIVTDKPPQASESRSTEATSAPNDGESASNTSPNVADERNEIASQCYTEKTNESSSFPPFVMNRNSPSRRTVDDGSDWSSVEDTMEEMTNRSPRRNWLQWFQKIQTPKMPRPDFFSLPLPPTKAGKPSVGRFISDDPSRVKCKPEKHPAAQDGNETLNKPPGCGSEEFQYVFYPNEIKVNRQKEEDCRFPENVRRSATSSHDNVDICGKLSTEYPSNAEDVCSEKNDQVILSTSIIVRSELSQGATDDQSDWSSLDGYVEEVPRANNRDRSESKWNLALKNYVRKKRLAIQRRKQLMIQNDDKSIREVKTRPATLLPKNDEPGGKRNRFFPALFGKNKEKADTKARNKEQVSTNTTNDLTYVFVAPNVNSKATAKKRAKVPSITLQNHRVEAVAKDTLSASLDMTTNGETHNALPINHSNVCSTVSDSDLVKVEPSQDFEVVSPNEFDAEPDQRADPTNKEEIIDPLVETNSTYDPILEVESNTQDEIVSPNEFNSEPYQRTDPSNKEPTMDTPLEAHKPIAKVDSNYKDSNVETAGSDVVADLNGNRNEDEIEVGDEQRFDANDAKDGENSNKVAPKSTIIAHNSIEDCAPEEYSQSTFEYNGSSKNLVFDPNAVEFSVSRSGNDSISCLEAIAETRRESPPTESNNLSSSHSSHRRMRYERRASASKNGSVMTSPTKESHKGKPAWVSATLRKVKDGESSDPQLKFHDSKGSLGENATGTQVYLPKVKNSLKSVTYQSKISRDTDKPEWMSATLRKTEQGQKLKMLGDITAPSKNFVQNKGSKDADTDEVIVSATSRVELVKQRFEKQSKGYQRHRQQQQQQPQQQQLDPFINHDDSNNTSKKELDNDETESSRKMEHLNNGSFASLMSTNTVEEEDEELESVVDIEEILFDVGGNKANELGKANELDISDHLISGIIKFSKVDRKEKEKDVRIEKGDEIIFVNDPTISEEVKEVDETGKTVEVENVDVIDKTPENPKEDDEEKKEKLVEIINNKKTDENTILDLVHDNNNNNRYTSTDNKKDGSNITSNNNNDDNGEYYYSNSTDAKIDNSERQRQQPRGGGVGVLLRLRGKARNKLRKRDSSRMFRS